MKISNRTTDITELRCHICQSFLKMVVNDDWRDILYGFVQGAVSGAYRDNYIEQYKIMRKKGIENYSIDDMDVPFIVNILRYCNPKIATLTKKTSDALFRIKGDRDVTGHDSCNEAEEELYLRALISLKDLQDFLDAVDIYEIRIPDEQRSQFKMKYSKEIDDLKLKVYSDCIELFQIKRDIQLIVSGDDPDKAFQAIYQGYDSRSHLSEENREQKLRFVIEASNAGIRNAHKYAAAVFLYILHDYDETTHRYEMMVDSCKELYASDAHELTDFINHIYMIGEKPTDRMLRLLKIVKDQGFDIEETPKGVIWKQKAKN